MTESNDVEYEHEVSYMKNGRNVLATLGALREEPYRQATTLNFFGAKIKNDEIVAMCERLCERRDDETRSNITTLVLQGVKITEKKMISLAAGLGRYGRLEKLVLSQTSLNDDKAHLLSGYLNLNPSLEELFLSKNPITGSGLDVLLQSCVSDTKLKVFSFQSTPISMEHCAAFAKWLRQNPPIWELHLGSCQIDDVKGAILFGAMQECTHIQYINIDNNGLGLESMRAFANWLKQDSCPLYHIILSRNKIDEYGCTALAEGLASNFVLRHLDLGYNELFNDECAKMLMNGLMVNKTLFALNLSLCNLTEAICEPLSDLVRGHPNLRKLLIGQNTFGPGIAVFARGIAEAPNLFELNLESSRLDEEGARQLAAGLRAQGRFVKALKESILESILQSRETHQDVIPDLGNLIIEFVGITQMRRLILRNNGWNTYDPAVDALVMAMHVLKGALDIQW